MTPKAVSLQNVCHAHKCLQNQCASFVSEALRIVLRNRNDVCHQTLRSLKQLVNRALGRSRLDVGEFLRGELAFDRDVFGDHRDVATGIGSRPSWQLSFEGCQRLIERLKGAGGQAQMLGPAETGVKGNSHMIMQDKNNLQIADLILKWIDERVSKRSGEKK